MAVCYFSNYTIYKGDNKKNVECSVYVLASNSWESAVTALIKVKILKLYYCALHFSFKQKDQNMHIE